ncbi:MAG: DUF4340 domain-containing protein [Chloroflexi bacterium]|nr:DUF4340 domain-containing protein [Chloroflexota bacterium]
MNVRLTGVLVAIFAVLVVVAVVSGRGSGAAASATPTPNLGVFTFKPADVKELTISYEGKGVTVSQPSPGTWKLVSPPAAYSDSTHIAGVVATLANLQKIRDVPIGTNSLSVFGFDKPYLTATADLSNGQQETLIVGGKNPEGSGYYAQVKGKSGLFIVSLIDVGSLAQLVVQPPIATPTAVPTPLATPASVPTVAPAATATP